MNLERKVGQEWLWGREVIRFAHSYLAPGLRGRVISIVMDKTNVRNNYTVVAGRHSDCSAHSVLSNVAVAGCPQHALNFSVSYYKNIWRFFIVLITHAIFPNTSIRRCNCRTWHTCGGELQGFNSSYSGITLLFGLLQHTLSVMDLPSISLFYYEFQSCVPSRQQAFNDAITELDMLSEEIYKDSTLATPG